MARKKQEVKPEAAPSKKVAKKSASKSAKPAAPKKVAAPKPDNAKKLRTKHEDVPNEVVLSALGSGKPLSKSELVAACGGDAVAVTKTIQRLRGLGQIVVKGSTRNAVYTKAA